MKTRSRCRKEPGMSASTKKVLPFKAHSTRRAQAEAKTREGDNGIGAIACVADDLCIDIRETITVIGMASEAWCGGQHESFVGVLDVLDYKLRQIEHEAQDIMDRVKRVPQ